MIVMVETRKKTCKTLPDGKAKFLTTDKRNQNVEEQGDSQAKQGGARRKQGGSGGKR
jgi:hypothetical protein